MAAKGTGQSLFPECISITLAMGMLVLAGCSTPVASAPKSSISRQNAVAFAQQTADLTGGRVFTVAPTGSMKPTLDENSVVTVEVVRFDQLRKGDIVIYRNAAGVPVVHRLIENTKGSWYVLGDSNVSVDREAVTPANLVGRVCAIFYTSGAAPDDGRGALALQ